MVKMLQATSYRTVLPTLVTTPTQNNQEDIFRQLHQSPRIADCPLQISISLPTAPRTLSGVAYTIS